MPKRPPPQTTHADFGQDGLSTEEIAALEHVSESMIRNIIARAFRKLRAECQRRNLRFEDVLGRMMGE